MMTFEFNSPEEEDKFTAIYEAYGKMIYYTLKQYPFDECTIEDLSQDIFIIIFRHLNDIDLDEPKKTRNYIITITRNYCSNFLRDKRKKPEIPFEEIPMIKTGSDGVLDQLIRKEWIHDLSNEIAELDDIYKSVLEMKYINGLDNDEIASALKIGKKTVEMRLYRAKQILRKKLMEQRNK